jgi:hypothetical protein
MVVRPLMGTIIALKTTKWNRSMMESIIRWIQMSFPSKRFKPLSERISFSQTSTDL